MKNFHRCAHHLYLPAVLVVLTSLTFARVVTHDFVGYDDPRYIITNRHVQGGISGEGVLWAFTSTDEANWHPLTWLSHMADAGLFGMQPWGHHLSSLLFHVINVVLLFLVLQTMTGARWKSFLVAALFGVHPLHVESVAWVSERKDVLSTFFWGLALLCYAKYVRGGRVRMYAAVAMFFAFGLMAKPMVMTLPFLLLLLDMWPLARGALPEAGGAECVSRPSSIRLAAVLRLLVEKTPLLLLSLLSAAVTFMAQERGGMVKPAELYPLSLRLQNAAVSYAHYMVKAAFPLNLSMPYAFSAESLSPWKGAAAAVLLAAITVLVSWQAKRRPYLAVGWFWYVGGLLPVIGLVQLADQSMADRYTYVPLTGLLVILSWGVSEYLGRKKSGSRIQVVLGCLAIGLSAVMAHSQARHWHDMESLVSRALEVSPENWLAHNNMGKVRESQGRTEEAISHYEEAIRINPRFSLPYYNLGKLMLNKGLTGEAVRYYKQAIEVNPGFDDAYNDLGVILARQGKLEEAIACYREALRINPEFPPTHNNLGYAYLRLNRVEEAIFYFREALRLEPEFSKAMHNLAAALVRKGEIAEAAEYRRRALQLESSRPQ